MNATIAVAGVFAAMFFATIAVLAGACLCTATALNRRQARLLTAANTAVHDLTEVVDVLNAMNEYLAADNTACHDYVDAAVGWLTRDLLDGADLTDQEQP